MSKPSSLLVAKVFLWVSMILRIQVSPEVRSDSSYAITVASGLLLKLPALLARRWKGARAAVITDSRVARLYAQELLPGLLKSGLDPLLLDVREGESSKNGRTVAALQTHLLRWGIRRDSLVIALGGGVVGDIAGFVAATVLRGVPYIQVPTTLLAQVDSSVGGKVGIDHPLGKNLIGAFYRPAAVYIDPQALQTLSSTEFRNGLAEMVKIAVALDAGLFNRIERNITRIDKHNPKLLTSLIAECVALKAAVVENDEYESGLRKALNVGHSIGHALETATRFRLRHGEAVAIGLALESQAGVMMGVLRERDLVRILNVLRNLGLPTTLHGTMNRTRFFDALSRDKKGERNGVKYSLLRGIGSTAIGVEVPIDLVGELLRREQ